MRGAGRVLAAAMLLLIAGTVNIIYGIGALDDANIFVNDKRYIFTNLNTMGWVLIVLGVIQLTGGFSLFAGNTYGRVIGIIGGSLGAIAALFSIGGNDPWWSLAVFFLCIYIVHGIFVYGDDERVAVRADPQPRIARQSARRAGAGRGGGGRFLHRGELVPEHGVRDLDHSPRRTVEVGGHEEQEGHERRREQDREHAPPDDRQVGGEQPERESGAEHLERQDGGRDPVAEGRDARRSPRRTSR